MTRRPRMAWACIVSSFAAFGVAPSVRFEPPRYVLEITPIEPPTMRSVVMTGSEGVVCRGHVDLMIDGAPRRLSAFAAFMSGVVLVKFESDWIPLSVWNRRYAVIRLDKSRVATQTLVVAEPTALAVEDDRALFHRAVMRTPARVIAHVRVDIRPNGSDSSGQPACCTAPRAAATSAETLSRSLAALSRRSVLVFESTP